MINSFKSIREVLCINKSADDSVFLDWCSYSEIVIEGTSPSHAFPVETSAPLPPTAMSEEIINECLSVMFDRKLSQQRNDILTEMKAIVSVNIQDFKSNLKEEIAEILGQMHDLQNGCDNLKSDLTILKKKKTRKKRSNK